MKSLNEMNNLDRAYLLATLFPEELKVLIEFIKKEADFFNQNREQLYRKWTEKTIDVNLWYEFIKTFESRYSKNSSRLYRNKKTFRDQLFDGYEALFTIHALVAYTEQKECSKGLKYAIYMLFGSHKIIEFNLNTKP